MALGIVQIACSCVRRADRVISQSSRSRAATRTCRSFTATTCGVDHQPLRQPHEFRHFEPCPYRLEQLVPLHPSHHMTPTNPRAAQPKTAVRQPNTITRRPVYLAQTSRMSTAACRENPPHRSGQWTRATARLAGSGRRSGAASTAYPWVRRRSAGDRVPPISERGGVRGWRDRGARCASWGRCSRGWASAS